MIIEVIREKGGQGEWEDGRGGGGGEETDFFSFFIVQINTLKLFSIK